MSWYKELGWAFFFSALLTNAYLIDWTVAMMLAMLLGVGLAIGVVHGMRLTRRQAMRCYWTVALLTGISEGIINLVSDARPLPDAVSLTMAIVLAHWDFLFIAIAAVGFDETIRSMSKKPLSD